MASCRALREVCDAHGTLLVFDEVISGFRVGTGRRAGAGDVMPDLTCLGKIIGGGLPVGAYGGRADLMELVVAGGTGVSGGHAVGQPARHDRRTLVPGPSDNRRSIDRSRRSARSSPRVSPTPRARRGVALQVNAFGSLLTPFFTDRPGARLPARRTARTPTSTRRFFRGMLARGIYLPPSQFEAWFLSAAHTRRDVDKTIAAAREAMKEVARWTAVTTRVMAAAAACAAWHDRQKMYGIVADLAHDAASTV